MQNHRQCTSLNAVHGPEVGITTGCSGQLIAHEYKVGVGKIIDCSTNRDSDDANSESILKFRKSIILIGQELFCDCAAALHQISQGGAH